MNHQSFSRRTFLRGVGVSMALPWMESFRVWGDEAKAVRGASEAPVRLAVLFAGNGFHGKEWWAKGSGRDMELGQVLAPAGRLPRANALHPRALQRRGPEGQHPQLADRQPALRRPAGLGRRDPLGHELRPASGASPRQVDQGAQPGAGLREVEPVGSQELFDALQLAHLVDLADDADAAGALPRAGVRSAVPRRGRARRQERPRRRAGRRTRLPPLGQPGRSAQAGRISRLGARGRGTDRASRQARRAARLAAHARQAQHPAPGRRNSARHRRAHAA